MGSILRFSKSGVLNVGAKNRHHKELVGAEKIEPTVSIIIGIMGANDQVLVEGC